MSGTLKAACGRAPSTGHPDLWCEDGHHHVHLGLDREGECPCRQGMCWRPLSHSPRRLWDVDGECAGCASRQARGDGGEGHPCGLWLTCGVTLNMLLTCPVQVTFMAWGRHSGWHCTHSEFSTNSLGSLTGEDGKLVSAVPGHPAAGCCLGSPVWELRWHKSPLLESQNSFR